MIQKQRFNRIKLVLVENDKSAKWLSEQLGKDKSTVSRWCTNDIQPSVETFFQIAAVLKIDVRDLFVSTELKKEY